MAFFRKDPQQVAEKLVKKGRIEAAIKEFKKVLEKDPSDPNTLNRIGDLYVRLRKSSEAADYYAQTAQKYAGDGFYVKAIAVYKKIHRIEPSRFEVLLRLAELYERQGLVNDARAHYTQLAEHYARQQDHRSVVETYQRMVDLEPENPGHRLKLADAYRQLDKLDEALEVYLELGALMIKHGHADHAVQVFERAIELAPDDLDFLRQAISLLRDAGELETANGLIDTATETNPGAANLRELLEERSTPTIELEPEEPIVVEAGDEEGEGLEGWQAVPEAMGGIAPDPLAEVGAEATGAQGAEPFDSGAIDATPPVEEPEAEAPAEVPEDGLWEISGSWSFSEEGADEEEIELDPLGVAATEAETPLAAEDEAEPLAEQAVREADSAEADRRREDRERDLLAEADVFIKYGLSQKAVERLEEILAGNPGSEGAVERLLAARLERSEEQAVIDLARRVRNGEIGVGQESWDRFEHRLAEAGYRIEADRLLALDTGDRPAASGQMEEAVELPVETSPAADSDFIAWDDEVEEIEIDAEPVEASLSEQPAQEAMASESPVPADSTAGDVVAPAAFEFASDGSEGLADSELLDSTTHDAVPSSWLEEEPAGEEGDGERIFEEERQFFDLADELRPELEEEVGNRVERADEQSLDEIVEGFKRGVAENISEEDSDTHYNLGIAYREMMLIDEAIGEFQIAAKSPDHRADACTMLGQCYREKGMSDLAVKWYQRALDTESLDSSQRAGLLYELGQTFEAMDDRESAYYTYLELRGVDSSFRDVRERIESLQ